MHHRFLPCVAVGAVLTAEAVALSSAAQSGCEAVAVELQALRFLAVALDSHRRVRLIVRQNLLDLLLDLIVLAW